MPSILTAYASKIIKNKLNDKSLSLSKKLNYINKIIGFIDDDNNDKIKEHDKLLTAVISKEEEIKLKATNKSLVRPLSGFRVSNLLPADKVRYHWAVKLKETLSAQIRYL